MDRMNGIIIYALKIRKHIEKLKKKKSVFVTNFQFWTQNNNKLKSKFSYILDCYSNLKLYISFKCNKILQYVKAQIITFWFETRVFIPALSVNARDAPVKIN